jgi:hypothetical protein
MTAAGDLIAGSPPEPMVGARPRRWLRVGIMAASLLLVAGAASIWIIERKLERLMESLPTALSTAWSLMDQHRRIWSGELATVAGTETIPGIQRLFKERLPFEAPLRSEFDSRLEVVGAACCKLNEAPLGVVKIRASGADVSVFLVADSGMGSPDRFAFGPIYLPTESNSSQPAYWLSKRGPILVAAVGNLTTTELGRVLDGVLVDP